MSSLPGGVKNLSKVNQTASDQVLGDEFLPVASNELPVASYSPNLLKNFSFETNPAAAGPSAFWTFHPNSTNSNTQMSNHTAHSGSYSLLLSDKDCNGEVSSRFAGRNCSLGVIQESTKTETKRNYELRCLGENGSQQPNLTTAKPFLHLALGPGWDRSFKLDGTEDNEVCETSDRCVKFRKLHSDGWKYYSTSFSSPPPGLVPRIYAEVQKQGSQEFFVSG